MYPCQIRSAVFAIFCVASTLTFGQPLCHEQPTHIGWRVFVNDKYGFCFEYPPKYKIAPIVRVPGVSEPMEAKLLGNLATKPESANLAAAQDEDNAVIDVTLLSIPFKVDSLRRYAPTGLQDIPPKRVPAAHAVFYYYGPGGGGVDYDDSYFVDLRGRTLWIAFSGPYAGDKTPVKATKDLEPQILKSFRRFYLNSAPK